MATGNELDGFKSDAEKQAQELAKERAGTETGVDLQQERDAALAAEAAAGEGAGNDAQDDTRKKPDDDQEGDDSHELDMAAGTRRTNRLAEISRKSLQERGLTPEGEEGDEQPVIQPARNLPENVYEKDGQMMVRMKVNGEEIERPLNDTINIAQKNLAGEKRLHQSAKVMQELQKQRADLEAREQRLREATERLQRKPTDSGSTPSDTDAADLEATAEALVDAIYHDDPKKAAEHARKLVQGRSNTATPQETAELQSVVDSLQQEQQEIGRQKELNSQQMAEVQQKVTEDWQKGLTRFQTDYPDIKKGTEAWRTASNLSRAIQLEAEFKDASFEEIFLEAGKRTRAALREASPSLQERTTRKLESAPHTAGKGPAASITRQSSQQQPARKSQRDLVADMRRQRRPYVGY